MEHHLRTSETGHLPSKQSEAPAAIDDRVFPALGETDHPLRAPRRAALTLVSPRVWTHTLVLTGELHSRSAPTVEEEIECLCQEGVATLRLDLRQLESIDSLGIAVIAYRSQDCERRGCDFAVIPGSLFVRRALAEAGVTVLTPERAKATAEPGPARAQGDPSIEAPPTPIPVATKLALHMSDVACVEGRARSLRARMSVLVRWRPGG
jgi:anti-anti-sigma factor